MSHDASKTQHYVTDALNRYSHLKNPVDRNRHAFAYLRGLRRRGDEPLLRQLRIVVPDIPSAPFDESLADAEHYMYARFLASDTGDPTVKTLVAGYEVKKFIASKLGNEQDMRTNPKYPVLPPSTEAITWGLKGADDGLRDFRNEHGGKLGELGSAVKTNSDFIRGAYHPNYASKY